MPKKLLSLIKWLDGDDDGQYSVGIDTQWIKEFNYEKYKDDLEDPDRVYVIEWHDQKKEPLGGWECYTGIIVAVSDSINVLEKKLKIINVIESPLKVVDRNVYVEEEVKNKKINEGNNRKRTIKKNQDDNDDIDARKKLSFGSSITEGNNLTLPNLDVEIINEISVENDVELLGDSRVTISKNLLHTFVTKADLKEALELAMSKNHEIESSKSHDHSNSRQNTGFRSDGKAKNFNCRSSCSQDTETVNCDLKEIGTPGSNIFIPMSQWNLIKIKPTFTSMTRALLIAAFDTETLIKSNYKGGKSKVKTIEEGVKYDALDSNIVKAIKETVRNKFKNSFNEGKFGTEINNKLAALRREARQQKAKKQNENEMEKKEQNDKDEKAED